jgi:hypothetical protein
VGEYEKHAQALTALVQTWPLPSNPEHSAPKDLLAGAKSMTQALELLNALLDVAEKEANGRFVLLTHIIREALETSTARHSFTPRLVSLVDQLEVGTNNRLRLMEVTDSKPRTDSIRTAEAQLQTVKLAPSFKADSPVDPQLVAILDQALTAIAQVFAETSYRHLEEKRDFLSSDALKDLFQMFELVHSLLDEPRQIQEELVSNFTALRGHCSSIPDPLLLQLLSSAKVAMEAVGHATPDLLASALCNFDAAVGAVAPFVENSPYHTIPDLLSSILLAIKCGRSPEDVKHLMGQLAALIKEKGDPVMMDFFRTLIEEYQKYCASGMSGPAGLAPLSSFLLDFKRYLATGERNDAPDTLNAATSLVAAQLARLAAVLDQES